MEELHTVKRYRGNLMDDIRAAAELGDDLPEGCKDIGQIKSGSEIFAETMASFAAIFGVQK